MGTYPTAGTPLKARILDVSKDTGIVDVSLRPPQIEAAAAAAASSKAQEEGQGDKEVKASKKRKAEEALDAAHAADSALKVS